MTSRTFALASVSLARRRVRPESLPTAILLLTPYLHRRTLKFGKRATESPDNNPILPDLPSIVPPKPVPDRKLVKNSSVIGRLCKLLQDKQVRSSVRVSGNTKPSRRHTINKGTPRRGLKTIRIQEEVVVRRVVSNSDLSPKSHQLDHQAGEGDPKLELSSLLAQINNSRRKKSRLLSLQPPSSPLVRKRVNRLLFSDPNLSNGFLGPFIQLELWANRTPGVQLVKFLRSHPRSSRLYVIPGILDAIPELPILHNDYKGQGTTYLNSMRAHIQFVTVPTADTPGTALYLAFDQRRYLIGQVSEGLQRACVQDGFAMKKIRDILITGNATVQSTGGLIGMILTLADVTAGIAKADEEAGKRVTHQNKGRRGSDPIPLEANEGQFLSLYGPQNLAGTLAAARRFVFRKGMPIKVHEIKSDEAERNFAEPSWSDTCVRVWTFAVTPKAGEREADHSPLNSRKRTFDEVDGAEAQTPDQCEEDRLRQKADDQIRHGIVADMFGSKWRMDTLVERRLDTVKLPAKMWVRNPITNNLDEYKGPLPGGSEPLPDPMPVVLTRNPWPGALVYEAPRTSPYKAAVSYIIVQQPRRGKFDINAARNLPIEKHMYNQLTKGQNVIGSDGSTITPDMVLSPDQPGKGVAVIDLPSLEYVQELVDRPEWRLEQVTKDVGAIVWILGRGVADSPVLREFIEARKNMEHIVSSPDFVPNSLTLDSVSTSAIKLAAIDMTTFPVPHHDNKLLPQSSCGVPPVSVQVLPDFVRVAKRGSRIQIDPDIKFLEDEEKAPLDTLSLIRESNSQETMELARVARTGFDTPGSLLAADAWVSQIPMPDVEITTLGTGSALPSKYRNVSSTLVRVPGHGSYLFDAGENTMGQLRRVFKPDELEQVLRDLRMIWISHLHADHHLGTSSVIKAWHQVVHPSNSAPPISDYILDELRLDAERGKDLRGRYLTVVSHVNMLHYLEEYDQIENFGYSHVLPIRMCAVSFREKMPSCLLPMHRNLDRQAPLGPEMLRALMGVEDLQAVHVSHCYGAMAVSVTFPFATMDDNEGKMPFKVSYSGDARPSQEFAKIGHDSTVLIHEATFEDEMLSEAMAKKHSTVSEALGVGSLMRAKAVVLTHFSQRYSKIPILDGFWDKQANLKKAFRAGSEEQERLQIDDGEDEIQGVEEEEVEKPIPELVQADGSVLQRGQTVAKVDFFDKPLGSLGGRREAKDEMKVAIAFDYMKFRLRDIPRMEALRPALAKLFEEDIGSETSSKIKATKKEQKAKKEAVKKEAVKKEAGKKSKVDGEGVKAGKGVEVGKGGEVEKDKRKDEIYIRKKPPLVALAEETLVPGKVAIETPVAKTPAIESLVGGSAGAVSTDGVTEAIVGTVDIEMGGVDGDGDGDGDGDVDVLGKGKE